MEIFLGFCFISAMIGFFIVLGSRKRYVRKCAKLQQENNILKQQIDNLRNSSQNSYSVGTANIQPPVQTAPNQNAVPGGVKSVAAAIPVNPSVTAPAVNVPVAAPVQVAQQAQPVAPTQNVAPQQMMNVAPAALQPVAPTQTVVPQNVAPVQQSAATQNIATPVVPQQPQPHQVSATQNNPAPAIATKAVQRTQAPKKEKSKLNVVGLSFGAGVLMLIIAAAVFITATWNMLPAVVKIPTLFSVVAVVFGISMLCTKKFKIDKTGSALYILGSCLLPLAIFGTALTFDSYSGLLVLILCSLSLMLTGYLGYKVFKSNFQIGVSIFGLAWMLIFISMEILGVMEGFFVGFAIVTAIFTGINKFFPDIKSFNIASQIVSFASLIVMIICGIGMFAADEFEVIAAFTSSFVIITASGYAFRRNVFHFVSSMIGIATFIVFVSYRIVGNSTGVIFGLAIAIVIYNVIAKLLPSLKEFNIASELITYAGIIDYVVNAYFVCDDSLSSTMFVLNVISLFILTVAILLLAFKRKVFKYVSPVFVAATLPILVDAFRLAFERSDALVIGLIVFAYVYIVVAGFVMKKFKVANWLASGCITASATLAGLIVDEIISMNVFSNYTLYELLAYSVPFVAAVLSYWVRRTPIERILYSLVIGLTVNAALAESIANNIAYVYIIMGISVVLCVAVVITKKLPFLYEGYAFTTLFATVVTSLPDDLQHKFVVVTVLLAALAAVVMFNYKKGAIRDVIISVISALAVASTWGIVGYAIKNDTVATSIVIGITFAIYLATILVIRFKDIKTIAVDTFKNLMVVELAIACFIFVAPNELVALIVYAVIALATLLEVRNFANFIPVAFTVIKFFDLINITELPIAGAFTIVLATMLVFTFIGRMVNPRIFSAKMGIDWFTAVLPFTVSALAGFDDMTFYSLIAFGFYSMTFIGRFREQEEDFKTGFKKTIKLISSVAIMFVGFAFMSASFIDYPEMFTVEFHLAYIVIAAAIVRFVIKLPKAGRWIWFLAVAFFVHVEAFAAIIQGTDSQLTIMAIIGIGLFVISFIIKNKTWFILAIETIGGIGVYLAISYWDSALWWVYLLVAGLLLIGTATFSEVKRRKAMTANTAEGEVVVKRGRFQEWKW